MIVAFKPGVAAAVRTAVAAARGQVALEIAGMDAMAVEVPAAALNGLARNPNVEYVEPDEKRYPLALTTPSTGAPYAGGQLVPYGTSMATPHVSAVAALVWSRHPGCTAARMRNSLNKSALDLDPAGRDTKFGFGLLQAKARARYEPSG